MGMLIKQRDIHNSLKALVLIQGRDSMGLAAYWFISADKAKLPILQKECERQAPHQLNLRRFGQIIASGYGEDVPEDIQRLIDW
ncbi:MAG TPA: hypothetical protein VFV38_43235 [Ktedonobacteraceae bacterium]|nr:hypothetical protein [Ktedonobacteraceae bacterium]